MHFFIITISDPSIKFLRLSSNIFLVIVTQVETYLLDVYLSCCLVNVCLWYFCMSSVHSLWGILWMQNQFTVWVYKTSIYSLHLQVSYHVNLLVWGWVASFYQRLKNQYLTWAAFKNSLKCLLFITDDLNFFLSCPFPFPCDIRWKCTKIYALQHL